MFKNTLDNKRYYTLNCYFKNKFAQKVYKVPLDIKSGCPNQANGGCIFCSNRSTSNISISNLNIIDQFEHAKNIMERKWPNGLYIPYFQSGSNTYNDPKIIKNYVDKLLIIPKVVGIAIATRPDCLSEEWLDYLNELNKKTFLMVELGLQSSNNQTLNFINRGHNVQAFTKAVEKLHNLNIFVVAHIINGLPNETKNDMLNTIKYLNAINIDAVKIHMLYIAKNTTLAKIYQTNPFHILKKEEYVDIVCNQLELLNENIVIERVTGNPIKEELVTPKWLLNKIDVLNSIDKEMVKRDIYQGDKVN